MRHGVSYATVCSACLEAGLTVKRQGGLHPYVVLAKLRVPGAHDAQVARECGITRQRVRQLKERAKELGLLD